jgi:hypothetical protein
MLTGRRVTIAVVLAIALVFGLAGWRYFAGETQTVSVARAPAPAAKTAAPVVAPVVPADASASLNQLEGTQQLLVDDLQMLEGRVLAQEAEIKRLKDELATLGQKFEALSSFASTTKEVKKSSVVEPPKKKKKRVVRRSKKR